MTIRRTLLTLALVGSNGGIVTVNGVGVKLKYFEFGELPETLTPPVK